MKISHKIRVCKCGKRAECWMTDGTALCGRCAYKQINFALACGVPVMMGKDGVPELILMPRLISEN